MPASIANRIAPCTRRLAGSENDLVCGAGPHHRPLCQVDDVQAAGKPWDHGGGTKRADLQRLQTGNPVEALVPARGADILGLNGHRRNKFIRRVALGLGAAADVAGAQGEGVAALGSEAATDGVFGVAEDLGIGGVGGGDEDEGRNDGGRCGRGKAGKCDVG